MIEKIYASQVDHFVDWLAYKNHGGFSDNCTFTEESYKLVDKFFGLLKKIEPVSENGCRELWFCVDRGTIEFFEGISDKDVADFISLVAKQEENSGKVEGRLYSMTANDFYKYCSIGYTAMGYAVGEMSPKEQYYRFADGRDAALADIDGDSSEEFLKWLNCPNWHGAHPWEVCRGGNSTHIDLYVRHDEQGFYLGLAGSSYGRTTETIKFYLALRRAGIPVILTDGKKLIERVMGTEKVGVVPHGITPRYCYNYFPSEDVISFMNLPYENSEKIAEKCIWQDIREVKLI